jgi:hypothetical protein
VEYEEEEIQVKEVEKEVVTEISMPQVRALYKYKGQGMGFDKGEVRPHLFSVNIIICDLVSSQLFILVSKTNKDWWAVK